MELTTIRPRLLAFRVLGYTGQTPDLPTRTSDRRSRVDQSIELNLLAADKQARMPPRAPTHQALRHESQSTPASRPGIRLRNEGAFSGTHEARFAYRQRLNLPTCKTYFLKSSISIC